MFIIAAHLLLLKLFIGFHIRVPAATVVVPIEIHTIAVITKFAAAPAKKIAPKIIKPQTQTPAPVTETETVSPEPQQPAAAQAPLASVPVVTETAPPIIETKPTPPSAATVATLPPPSANYLLQVVRTEPNVANPYYGSGEIRWEHDDKSYTMRLEVGVDLLFAKIRLYSMESEGTIGESGVRPKMMTESRRGRAATATHFNYDSNTISFSASTAIIPMTDGAQDRATVLMQLASIGNADPSQFQSGKEFTIQVAEDKDASDYQFVVVGEESIDTKLGHIETWHIVRPPRPGVYSSRLDVWVAPALNWLPIQIRNTETNGAITTETIRKIITGINE